MATDAEIDAAVAAMRAVRTIGGKIHDDVLRAYARAALEASARVQIEAFRKRQELRQQANGANPPADQGNGGQPHGS
jgi:hypothetical protein